MRITPDSWIIWQWGRIEINATLVFSWVVMGVLVAVAWGVTRKITVEPPLSRWQNLLETLVGYMRRTIREITHQEPDIYLPFLGTLFLYISVSNFLAVIPRYEPPTGSLSTTAALAASVFFAVPVFGVIKRGWRGYLKHYITPTVFMLPFNIIGELSRTLALAVRLFGNIMSGTLVVAILVTIIPLFVPVLVRALGLLIGQIQAYIFAVLATVYIASASRAREQEGATQQQQEVIHGRHQ